MPQYARHALPSELAGRRALLPSLLLLASAGALAGLAVLPTPADARPPSRSTTLASTGPGVTQHALSPASSVSAERERAVSERAARVAAAARSQERASRNRTRPPAPRAAAAAPAAAAPAPAAPAARVAPAKPRPPAYVRPGTGRLTSTYGRRWGRLHAGIDLAAGTGAPVSAVTAGTVLTAGDEGAYGRCVRVQHADGTVSVYAHLSAILVKQGQAVTAGTYLGREGSSGRSTGPHLHFEIRVGGVPVDPTPWLLARGVNPAQP